MKVWLPETIHARLTLEAYSPMHGKIPPRGLKDIVAGALQLYFDVKDGKMTVSSNVLP